MTSATGRPPSEVAVGTWAVPSTADAPWTESPRSWEAGSSLITVPSAFVAVMDGARTEPAASWSVLVALTGANSSEDSGSTDTARSETAGLGGVTARAASGPDSRAPAGSTSGP